MAIHTMVCIKINCYICWQHIAYALNHTHYTRAIKYIAFIECGMCFVWNSIDILLPIFLSLFEVFSFYTECIAMNQVELVQWNKCFWPPRTINATQFYIRTLISFYPSSVSYQYYNCFYAWNLEFQVYCIVCNW